MIIGQKGLITVVNIGKTLKNNYANVEDEKEEDEKIKADLSIVELLQEEEQFSDALLRFEERGGRYQFTHNANNKNEQWECTASLLSVLFINHTDYHMTLILTIT